MARDDVTSRASARLERCERALGSAATRWSLVAIVLAVTLGLAAATGDPRWGWLAALPTVLAGAVGGARFGVSVAVLVGGGLAAVDLTQGLTPSEVVSVSGRTVTLLVLGVTGAVVQRIESQRDTALVRSATEDPVTGLLNVRAFYDGLRALRRDGHDFSVLLADLVGMHELNEQHGHPTGTEALRALGHALRRSVKQGDLVARMGGDEVAIALVGASPEGAAAAAQRLTEVLADEALSLPDGSSLDLHVYFGIASYPTNARDEVHLLRAANHAVEAAKGRGPDQVAVSAERAEEV